MTNFNAIDIAVLVIFFMSIVAGLLRGFIKEVIAVVTWIVAFIVSVMFATRLASVFTSSDAVQSALGSTASSTGMNPAESVSYASIGISFICIFLTVLIIGKIVSYFIASAVEGQGISFGNRLLGGVFGLLRGFFITLFLMFVMQFTPFVSQAYWEGSQFVTVFAPALTWVNDVIKPGLGGLKARASQAIQDMNAGMIQGVSGAIQNNGQ